MQIARLREAWNTGVPSFFSQLCGFINYDVFIKMCRVE